MNRYVLGLDLGPSSVGWAAISLDNKGEYNGFEALPDKNPEGHETTIPAIGVRIFPAGAEKYGQGEKNEAPRNKKRRESRGMRRRLRRARGRRARVLKVLREHGLAPKSEAELISLQQQNPYDLRARGLFEQLQPYEIGRIILHMAKRRGFKSNRKGEAKDDDRGKVKEGIGRLTSAMQGKTLGQFWQGRLHKNNLESIRNKGDYQWVAQRGQYRDEFRKIWDKQFSDDGSKTLRIEIEQLLFNQIPFELSNRKKRKVIGKCTLLPKERRCSLSERIAQEFRLRQKVNDLRRNRKELDQGEKNLLVERLTYKKKLKIEEVRKALKMDEKETLNFEYEGSQALPGNEIECQLAQKKRFGKEWRLLDEEKKEEIWQSILQFMNRSTKETELEEEKEARTFSAKLKSKYGVQVEDVDSLRTVSLPDKHIRYSKKALDWILPKMREGMGLYDAIQAVAKEVGFVQTWRIQKKLPRPERENGIEITNPTVKTTLYEVRKVVNALIRELGKPERIIVELPREFKATKKHRQEIIRQQTENRRVWEGCEKRIREYWGWNDDVRVSVTDRIKYRLWEEQGHYCPYCCNKISVREILGAERETDIDHILPRSMSLDNSMNNRVVCHSKCNQDKLQNTPISWLGKDSEKWKKIETAIEAKRFGDNPSKWERFSVPNEEISEKYTPTRLLRETSYIGREVCKYLQRLYRPDEIKKPIGTTKGVITAELRNVWELNPILREGEAGPKNRDDLRHHAVDAAITAVTTVKMLQDITKVLQKTWPRRSSQAKEIPQPWKNFGQELAQAVTEIRISHRVQRKVRGALHKETYYWKETNGPHKGKYITRKPLTGITEKQADQICDERIKELVLKRIKEQGGKAKNAFNEPLYLVEDGNNKTPVRKVRIWDQSTTMIPIRGKESEPQTVWVAPGKNHHVEIIALKENKEEQEGVLITMYDASQRVRNSQPIIQQDHGPTKKFFMSLASNEMILLKMEDGGEILHRVQKISQSGNSISIIFRPHTYGGKMSDYDKPPLIQRRSPSTLKGRKVTIDPLGRIRWAEKKYWSDDKACD